MSKISLKEFFTDEVCGGECLSVSTIIGKILRRLPLRFVILYRLASILREKNIRFIPGIIMRHLVHQYGCYISLRADIGLGIKFPHPNGIVIGERVKIGKHCIIYHQVTLGGKVIGDSQVGNYPQIGDDVVIFAGAKLIGNIKIGNHSIVGANSVVSKDVPAYSVVAGIPAIIIKNNCCEKDDGDKQL
jgi:serine O-acetyltransferase